MAESNVPLEDATEGDTTGTVVLSFEQLCMLWCMAMRGGKYRRNVNDSFAARILQDDGTYAYSAFGVLYDLVFTLKGWQWPHTSTAYSVSSIDVIDEQLPHVLTYNRAVFDDIGYREGFEAVAEEVEAMVTELLSEEE